MLKSAICLVWILAFGGALFAQAQNSSAEMQLVKVTLQRVKNTQPQDKYVPPTDPLSQTLRRNEQMRTDVDSSPALHRLSKDAEVATGYDPLGGPGPNQMIFVASIVVKNLSKKTVAAVDWEYLMFETGAKQPALRVRVHSKHQIAPGEQLELIKEVQPKGKEQQAAITRIEYADGSVWQRPAARP